jgi:hypothetical protein
MKKLFMIPVILLFFLSDLKAQIENGKFIIGGNSSLSFASVSTKYKYDKASIDGDNISNIKFSPTFGLMVSDNLALGFQIQYEHAKQGDASSNAINIGPFVKHYFDVNSPNVFPFLLGELVVGSKKESLGNEEVKFNTSGFGLGGGIAILISDSATLDIGAGYASITQKLPEVSGLKLKGSGIALSVGFAILL